MIEISALLGKMVIFIVLMAIGYVCVRTKYLGQTFAKDASKLLINVFLTATILYSVINADIELSGKELAAVMAVITAVILLGYVVAAAACRLIPMEKDKRPLFELLIAVMNNMFIALPVVETLYGSEGVFYCSLSCIPFNIFLYTYGVYRLKSGKSDGGVKLKDIITMPIVASLLAILIFIFDVPTPPLVKELIGSISSVTMPLSMIVVGATLGSVSLLDSFKDWRMYIISLISLIVCPILTWLMVRLMTSDTVLIGASTIIAGAPSGVVVTTLAIQYDWDAVYTSKGIMLTTVLSMLTLPVIVSLLS